MRYVNGSFHPHHGLHGEENVLRAAGVLHRSQYPVFLTIMSKTRKKTQQRASHNPRAFGSGLRSDNKILKATIHGAATISSTGAGIINTTFSMDPSALTGTDWADFSSTYDEFRVIGCEITLVSLFQNSITAANNLLILAFDNDSSTAPTSYTTALQYSTSRTSSAIFQHSGGATLRSTWWRPTAGSETTIPWVDVAAPSGSVGAILLYSESLNLSAAYLAASVRLYVELRGRR